ncbi:MAG TPA: ABC transporter permease [Jatrophihabitantaceae bacterium]|nr:ABC transporter permease [Jatrophihabitantaceae bacterium]
MTDVQAGSAQRPEVDVSRLVAQYGLKRAGARPNIVDYTRQLWGRRHFMGEFSRANSAVGYSRSTLGQAWQVLTPLLNATVYYLIFGVLIGTKRGVHNYIAFLVIGIFIFTFTQSSMIDGARAISSNLGLTRVLHFPRAVLPVSSTLVALRQLLISLIVLIPIVLITGERPRLSWLLLVPVIALQALFCLGIACAIARIGAKVPDTSQILPFVMRTWLYASGVFYSISAFTKHRGHLVKMLLQINPGGVYVELARNALLKSPPPLPHYEWLYAVGWALVALIGGYAFFWQAEEQYGRV